MADDMSLPEPEPGFNLGVSVSGSADLARLGLTEMHLRMALGEVTRATLIAGGRITYGGHLDPAGYTPFLIHECEKYGARNRPFIGCIPLSVHAALTAADIADLRRDLGLLGRYIYLNADGDVIANPESDRVPGQIVDGATTVRALTGLRSYMTANTDGRILLGGKRTGYEGRMPGVIEELIMSIQAGKPVFVAGGFGGASADAVNALNLDPDKWLALPDRAGDHDLAELIEMATRVGWDPRSNGLTLDQNQQLAISYRASEIASLVVIGLSNLRRPS